MVTLGETGSVQGILARSLLLAGPRRLEWAEQQLPDPAPGMVLVQTVASAISIGSEVPQYTGTARSLEIPRYPRMTGYESLGRVIAVGEGVERVGVGDRVVAFYGHRSAALVQESRAVRVPEGISDRLALLAILTCDAAKGVRKITLRPEEVVLVTGAGALGLFTLFALRAYGVAAVDVIEPEARRHALALALGARRVLTPAEMEAAGTSGYPAAFECSSRDQAFALLQLRLAPNGRLCLLSDGNIESLTLTPAFHQKELHIFGSSDGWNYQEHAAWYFDYLLKTPTALAEVFQEEIAFEELPATFERLAQAGVRPVKVLVRYGSSNQHLATTGS